MDKTKGMTIAEHMVYHLYNEHISVVETQLEKGYLEDARPFVEHVLAQRKEWEAEGKCSHCGSQKQREQVRVPEIRSITPLFYDYCPVC